MINKIVKLFLFTIFTYFLLYFSVSASSKITLTSNIKGVSNNINNTFNYKIKPVHNTNAVGEPKEAKIVFSNSFPINNVVTEETVIDFSSVVFPNLGVYEYIVTEVDSEDSTTFPKSDQKFKIIVEVSLDENDNRIKKVFPQAVDLSDNHKTEFSLFFRLLFQFQDI